MNLEIGLGASAKALLNMISAQDWYICYKHVETERRNVLEDVKIVDAWGNIVIDFDEYSFVLSGHPYSSEYKAFLPTVTSTVTLDFVGKGKITLPKYVTENKPEPEYLIYVRYESDKHASAVSPVIAETKILFTSNGTPEQSKELSRLYDAYKTSYLNRGSGLETVMWGDARFLAYLNE